MSVHCLGGDVHHEWDLGDQPSRLELASGELAGCGKSPSGANGNLIRFSRNKRRGTSARSGRADGSAIQLSEPGGARPGYRISQRLRKRIEEPFGWLKSVAGLRKTRHRGLARVGWMFTLTATASNLVRLPKLLASAT